MLTFFHAPQSRSDVIQGLIDHMGIGDKIETRIIDVPRQDGSGSRDPSNPHPEGKAPVLMHDGVVITERAAIILHLTSLFPECGLAPKPGTPQWGAFATWLSWYQGVMEPVYVFELVGLSHPALHTTFRGPAEVADRLRTALQKGPWLVGETFSAADILIYALFAWSPQSMPDDALIRDWVSRCSARLSANTGAETRAGAVTNAA